MLVAVKLTTLEEVCRGFKICSNFLTGSPITLELHISMYSRRVEKSYFQESFVCLTGKCQQC